MEENKLMKSKRKLLFLKEYTDVRVEALQDMIDDCDDYNVEHPNLDIRLEEVMKTQTMINKLIKNKI
jgi:hypothetical protein